MNKNPLKMIETNLAGATLVGPLGPNGGFAQVAFGQQVVSANGDFTWTAPAKITQVVAQAWGAGGGGGGSGSGGGGGAYSASTLTVTPGNTYNGHVGAGGAGGATQGAGSDGAASWFDTTTTVYADSGKHGIQGDTVAGGQGGLTASGYGSTKFSGGSGGYRDPNGYSDGAGGGPGGSSAGYAANGTNSAGSETSEGNYSAYAGAVAPAGGGNGGAGGAGGGVNSNTSTAGSTGSAPGGGGGGGGSDSFNDYPKAGAAGADGQVVLTWFGSMTGYTLLAPTTATAGSAFNITLRAIDAHNQTMKSYTGSAAFATTDTGSVTIPATYAFPSSDNGIHVFSSTLATPGSQTITATDTASASITAIAAISVYPATPTGLTVTAGTGVNSVSWTAAEGDSTYTLEQSTDNATWSALSGATAISATSFTDQSPVPGIAYYYRVAATAASLTSSYSASANATDTAGSYPGTLENSPSWNTDVSTAVPNFGHSLTFTGSSSQYVACGTSSTINFTTTTQAFTLSARIKTTASGTMAYFGSTDTSGNGYYLAFSNGLPYVVIQTGSSNYLQQVSLTSIADGNWHTVTATYDGSQAVTGLKLYIDGTAQDANPATAGTLGTISGANFAIGAISHLGVMFYYYTGELSDCRLYSAALGATEVAAIAAGTVSGQTSTPIAWWKLNEGTGTTAYDAGGA